MRWMSAVAAISAVAAFLTAPAAYAAPGGAYGWPLSPRPAVVRGFDNPEHDWLPGHRGVDLAATPGQPVFSAGPGVVVFVGKVGSRNVVSVQHSGRLRTTYEPVRATVAAGARVSRGSPLGAVEPGHPGCAMAACLHWGLVRRDAGHPRGEYLDPLGLLHARAIRLEATRPGDAAR